MPSPLPGRPPGPPQPEEVGGDHGPRLDRRGNRYQFDGVYGGEEFFFRDGPGTAHR